MEQRSFNPKYRVGEKENPYKKNVSEKKGRHENRPPMGYYMKKNINSHLTEESDLRQWYPHHLS